MKQIRQQLDKFDRGMSDLGVWVVLPDAPQTMATPVSKLETRFYTSVVKIRLIDKC